MEEEDEGKGKDDEILCIVVQLLIVEVVFRTSPTIPDDRFCRSSLAKEAVVATAAARRVVPDLRSVACGGGELSFRLGRESAIHERKSTFGSRQKRTAGRPPCCQQQQRHR